MVTMYNQLCPVLFGSGAIASIADKVKSFGGTKALCVYDQGVKMTGIADKIIKSLNDAGIKTVIFDEVLPDAPDKVIDKAGRLAQTEKVDIVVGIGGGSSLDTAKAATILVQNPPPITQYFASKGMPFVSTTPLILIPTAAGTGSEVTIMSVVHDEAKHVKEGVLRPANLAIVDPDLTLTVPPLITAATGMDAMSHAIESYTTNCGNPKAEVLSLAAMRIIYENLEKACKDGGDLEARTNLSFASNIAGMAFTEASVHIGHAVAHEFGLQFHMQHGIGCALSLPECVTFSADAAPEKMMKIAEALRIKLPENATAVEAGEMIAASLRDLMHRVNIPSLKAQGITREVAVSCAHNAIANNWFVNCALKPVDDAVVAAEIGKMYDNYQ